MAKKNPGPLPWSWDEVSAKVKHAFNAATYFNYLVNIDISMFEYPGLPESIDARFLDIYLCMWNAAGIKKKEDGTYLLGMFADRGGELDQYGLGKELISSAGNGDPVTGTIGEDCCIIYNNMFMSADTDIIADAESMAAIDRSSGINVLFSRIAPVLGIPDGNKKDAIKQMMQNILDGNLDTVISDNILDGLGLGVEGPGLTSIDITQPERIQYIQYLSQYFDFVFRRHFARRGLPVRSSTKAAQQSADEVHGLDAVAWAYPLSKLQARVEGFKIFNRMYGENVQPRFSPLWQREYDKFMSDDLASGQDPDEGGEENADTAAEEGTDTAVSDL